MISIVSAYYNRKPQFRETLESIKNSSYKDFEYIVVDDGSDDIHRVEDLQSDFPFLKIIRLEKKDKWYVNPCIPFNIGIRETKGDIIILQNPECLHVHDILTFMNENVNDSNYLTISVYGLDAESNERVKECRINNTLPEFVSSLPQRSIFGETSLGWYNHSRFRPGCYHFCAGITRNNMKKLNGFDERFANGIGYDDDEFSARIRMLKLNVSIVDSLVAIHQHHNSVYWSMKDAQELSLKNRYLYHIETFKDNNYRAPNKIELWNGI